MNDTKRGGRVASRRGFEGDDESLARAAVIREAGLSVDDPETIPNRHHPIPAGVSPVRLLREYDTTRTTGRRVRCSACAHQQAHHRGFVAEMPDGRPALIGINCGEKHFGDGEWDRMHADLRRAQDEVYYEARVLPALTQIRTAYDHACTLKPFLEDYEANWRLMKVTLPELHALLLRACNKGDGAMERHVSRTVESVSYGGRQQYRTQVDTQKFGRVPAPHAFIAPFGAAGLRNTIATLRSARLLLESSADTRARRQAFADLAKGRRLAEDLVELVHGFQRNSAPEWWATARDFYVAEGLPGALTIKRGELKLWDGWDNKYWRIPACGAADVTGARRLLEIWPRLA